MLPDTRDHVSTCETCVKLRTEQDKETLMSHNIPDRLWQKIDVDLFEFDNIEYLITVDHFLNIWKIERLEDNTYVTVIRKLKPHFAIYKIACQVISNAGTQFTSSSFKHSLKGVGASRDKSGNQQINAKPSTTFILPSCPRFGSACV